MTLKAIRNTAGMTVEQVSAKTGIAKSTLYSYERLNEIPTRDAAKKLSKAFDLTFRELEPLVKDKSGMTRNDFETQAKDFKAKYEDVPASREDTEKGESTDEPITRVIDVNARAEETREIPENTHGSGTTLALAQIKTITDAEYREAVSTTVKALRRIIGDDSNKSIMLAVAFVTTEIENQLFVERIDR